jgi:hypothetical protein
MHGASSAIFVSPKRAERRLFAQVVRQGYIPFEPDIWVLRDAYRTADMDIIAVMQTVLDTSYVAYVAPLDVPTGARTRNKTLEDRYWSVFKADPLVGFARSVSGRDGRSDGGR